MPTQQEQLELPVDWARAPHQEVASHGIGEGFVLFEQPGQHLRGTLRTFFPTRHGLAVAIELEQPPTAPVYQTDENGERNALKVGGGDIVNLSLSGVDLKRKLPTSMVDAEVGVFYANNQETKAGAMKIFRVVVFGDDLPF